MADLFENYEDNIDLKPAFTNIHALSHSPREFYIIFGQFFPPTNKWKPVAKLFLSKENMIELMHNIGIQLKKFEEGKDEPDSPGKRI